jgi:tetratricopeptide (TPR) repeat protein
MDGYRRLIEADPSNPSLHNDLALLGIEAGDLPLAIAEFQQSLRLRPAAAASHYNVGNALLMAGRAGEAGPYFRDALRLDPDYGLAYQGLGLSLAATGALDDGASALERAVRLMPASADALYNLGVVRQAQGRDDDALAAYVGVLRLARSHGDAAYAAGAIHAARGDARGAAEFFRQAVAARPGWVRPLVELAWTLAVADGDVRRPKEALELARQASGSAGQVDARTSDVLAAALAANGLYAEAVAAASAAIGLLPENSDPRQRVAIERRLMLYREGKPFHADLH